jgi:hypothetical protein
VNFISKLMGRTMKTKIEIKTFGGSVLFTFETEDNTLRQTVEEAVKSRANLSGANLSRANLSRANLRRFRDDIWALLSMYPVEIPKLREAIVAGKIDGTVYEGECACLVGTVAKIRACSVDELEKDQSRLAEVWFWQIKKGDTPETNKFSKQALEWIDEWTARMQAAFGKPVKSKKK